MSRGGGRRRTRTARVEARSTARPTTGRPITTTARAQAMTTHHAAVSSDSAGRARRIAEAHFASEISNDVDVIMRTMVAGDFLATAVLENPPEGRRLVICRNPAEQHEHYRDVRKRIDVVGGRPVHLVRWILLRLRARHRLRRRPRHRRTTAGQRARRGPAGRTGRGRDHRRDRRLPAGGREIRQRLRSAPRWTVWPT